MRKYLLIILTALIVLSIINHRSIDHAVELCEEGKGEAFVEKDWFAFNWSVKCKSDDI